MNTTGFSLINESGQKVEFHVLPQGASLVRRYTLEQNERINAPTDSSVASYDVHVTADELASATLTSKHLNTTFTVTADSFSASESSPAQRRHMSNDERADVAQQLRGLRDAKDLDGLTRKAHSLMNDWHQKANTDPYLLDAVCSELASFDLGDWDAQEALVQQCAIAALSRSERLSALEEVSFALRLTEPANGKLGLLALPQRTGFWLRAWSRLRGAIDAAFDPADRPLLNVAPPAQSGLRPGIAPSSIEDPSLRAEYELAIEKNCRAAAYYRQQFQLLQAVTRMGIGLQRYLHGAYARPRVYVDELEKLLAAHLVQDADVTRRADILSRIKSAVAKIKPEDPQLPPTKVTFHPRDNFPGRSLTRFGIGEEIDLSLGEGGDLVGDSFGGVVWHVESGDATILSSDGNGHAMLRMGETPGVVCLTSRALSGSRPGAEVGRLELVGVAPTSATLSQKPGTNISHTHNTWSVGFLGRIAFAPSDVSYAGVFFREGEAVSIATGWLAGDSGQIHPVGAPLPIPGGIQDTVQTATKSAPYGVGEFNWPIPWQSSTNALGPWTQFMIANHHETSSAVGVATIEKAGGGPFTKNAGDATSSF